MRELAESLYRYKSVHFIEGVEWEEGVSNKQSQHISQAQKKYFKSVNCVARVCENCEYLTNVWLLIVRSVHCRPFEKRLQKLILSQIYILWGHNNLEVKQLARKIQYGYHFSHLQSCRVYLANHFNQSHFLIKR